MDKKEKTGVLNVRDLVNVGLFSVLIFIFIMVSIFNLDRLDFSRIQELEE